MRIDEIFPLTEVHWTDLYPKGFHAFRKKYLPMLRKGQANGLYVQFSNFANNTMDRTAFTKPDHSDPVGVYAYPIEYVLKFPADIWYGRAARYMRVLRNTSKSKMNLDYLQRESEVERALNRAGFSVPEIHSMIYLAKKHYKERLSGRNKFGKLFLACMQIDLLADPIAVHKGGPISKKGPEYRVRTGAEQTALFRKMQVDALEDTARNDKSAIINDREPEQIIFLTRAAFRVEEVFDLRAGIAADKLPVLTSPDPDKEIIVRPFAASLAKMMDDQISEWGRDQKTRKKLAQFCDYFWTKKGRRIEIEFKRPPSYYDDRTIGQKKHREDALSDGFMTFVTIETEFGKLVGRYGQPKTFQEIVDDLRSDWRELQKNPTSTSWTPQSAESYAAAEKAKEIEAARKRVADQRKRTLSEWPKYEEDIRWVAEHFNLPFRSPSTDDAIIVLDDCLDFLNGNRVRSLIKAQDISDFISEWRGIVDIYTDAPKYKAEGTDQMVKDTVDDLVPILEKGLASTGQTDWLRFGAGSFAFLKQAIKEKAARGA